MYAPKLLAVGLVFVAASASAQTWCNKHYKANQSHTSPGGNFAVPSHSSTPLLALRCAPAIKPYLPDDTSASIIIDAPIVYSHIVGAKDIALAEGSGDGGLEVTVSVDGKVLTKGSVSFNASKLELPFDLSSLTPRKEAYNLTCSGTYSSTKNQTFSTTGSLAYLPTPPSGTSVTKMDLRTGALLAKPADGKGKGEYGNVFPIGFYTDFDGYLAKNLTVLEDLKAQGFTIVHPVPTFENETVLEQVLDKIQEVGLYLMYDMRFTYMNTTSVTTQVNSIKSRPNLLLWYTADEPDGTSDPLSAPSTAYDLIHSLDGGGYHPISLVLNCADYEFTSYAAGADILMQDAYMIGNNATWSTVWGTECTDDFGDCGCDDCEGVFEDISRRVDSFKERMSIMGWERTKVVWTVPQAFGEETYWPREPTGKEWLIQSILGVNHGALGIVPWDDPTPADIKASASSLAKALPALTPFLFSPNATFANITTKRVDVGLWTVSGQTLLLAANMNGAVSTLDLSVLPGEAAGKTVSGQVFDGGAKADGGSVSFEALGSGAFILK